MRRVHTRTSSRLIYLLHSQRVVLDVVAFLSGTPRMVIYSTQLALTPHLRHHIEPNRFDYTKQIQYLAYVSAGTESDLHCHAQLASKRDHIRTHKTKPVLVVHAL